MEKLSFIPAQGQAPVEFYVVAQTLIKGRSYLLVTDTDPEGEEDTEAFILRDDSAEADAEACYTMVSDDAERDEAALIFQGILEEEDISLEE
ncbi:MAG: DUF1292 domain-containing protein [Lachnospiraceae bacterium]|nr:DUF1292 domain-containing protein [Lachnospiraceae bacterium]